MSKEVKPKIEEAWKKALTDEFNSAYFKELKNFLIEEKAKGKNIFPPGPQIFNAFNSTPFEDVRVVIIGQDPYHGKGQAHGLCFSVNKGITIPPSLKNIYKELESDLHCSIPNHGDLSVWAKQGVLLLNAILTVQESKPGSHRNKGWEQFTNAAISKLSEKRKHLVFLLWGRFAQEKEALIDSSRHLILKATHPSPFSADRGFFGCRHFSKCNEYLEQKGIESVNWQIS